MPDRTSILSRLRVGQSPIARAGEEIHRVFLRQPGPNRNGREW